MDPEEEMRQKEAEAGDLLHPGPAGRVVLAAIRLWQLAVSPLLPPACRFEPSCSRYAHEAVTRHGLRRGAWLALRRLGACHPLHPGGYDPVP